VSAGESLRWERPDGTIEVAKTLPEMEEAMEVIAREHAKCSDHGDHQAASLLDHRYRRLFELWRDLKIRQLQDASNDLTEDIRLLELRLAWWDEMRSANGRQGEAVTSLQREIIGSARYLPLDWQEAAIEIDSRPMFDVRFAEVPGIAEANAELVMAGYALLNCLGACFVSLVDIDPRSEEYRHYREITHPALHAAHARWIELAEKLGA
jgi:hypothetical protein